LPYPAFLSSRRTLPSSLAGEGCFLFLTGEFGRISPPNRDTLNLLCFPRRSLYHYEVEPILPPRRGVGPGPGFPCRLPPDVCPLLGRFFLSWEAVFLWLPLKGSERKRQFPAGSCSLPFPPGLAQALVSERIVGWRGLVGPFPFGLSPFSPFPSFLSSRMRNLLFSLTRSPGEGLPFPSSLLD